jgi:DNA-binding transcriptional MerR regulator
MQLTAAQQNVLNHLAAGKSISEAAELCGVHRNTIANWRRQTPAFTTLLNEAVRERALFFQEEAQSLIPKAIEVLRNILHNGEAGPSVLLRAALAVLKMAPQPEAAPEPQSEPQAEPEPEQPLETRLQESLAAKIREVQAQQLEIQENMHKFAQPPARQPIRRTAEPGRNSQCPCGSGVKYKRCCANKTPQATAAAA